jgi:hypothetical protein
VGGGQGKVDLTALHGVVDGDNDVGAEPFFVPLRSSSKVGAIAMPRSMAWVVLRTRHVLAMNRVLDAP